MSPFRVLVAQPFHPVHDYGLNVNFHTLAGPVIHRDDCRTGTACTGNISDAVFNLTLPAASAGVVGSGYVVHGCIVGQEALIGMPLVASFILKPTRQAALVIPDDRQPIEMHRLELGQGGTAGICVTHWPQAPGAIFQPHRVATVHLQFLAVVTNPALPATKLVQARCIHHHMTRITQGLAPFLDARRCRRKHKVCLNTCFVCPDLYPVASHGLQYAQGEGTAAGVCGFIGGTAGAVKSVLVAINGQTETAVQNAQVRVPA